MSEGSKDMVKEQIIKAASIIFGKYGYKKTTMDDIGQATGKGKTAIYYYFKNKEDVFKAVVEKEASELEQALVSVTTTSETAEEKLKAYFQIRMQVMLNLSNFYNAMKSELLDHLSFINKIRKDVDDKELQIVKSILKEGIKQKQFAIKDFDMTALMLVTVLKGLEIPLFVEDKVKDLSQYMELMIRIICFGIVKR